VSKKEILERELLPHLEQFLASGEMDGFLGFIKANSNLPGPRANLELADVFAEVIAGRFEEERDLLWGLCMSMVQLSPEKAPVNSPQEFIPFCGAVAIGKLGSLSRNFYVKTISELRRLSRDPRWRTREAVRMGLQFLIHKHPEETLQRLQGWFPAGELLEMRAVAAAVSDPELLQDRQIANSALQIHGELFEHVRSVENRKTEAFRVLRKALGYTLSLVVVELPEKGFELMDTIICSRDPDLLWIVKSNLKKKRLFKKFPEQVEARSRRL
jgi:hypothetical protein